MFKEAVKKILAYAGIGIKPIPRQYLTGGKDLKKIKIGKYDLLINKEHTLDYNIRQYPLYNKNLPRLTSFMLQQTGGCTVVDVGANVGDTVLFIKNEADVPVVCFEGDPYYFKLLQQNVAQFSNVTCCCNYLAAKDSTLQADIDFSKGTSSINESSKGAVINLIKFDTFYNNNKNLLDTVIVFKTDTDGYDLNILRGAWNFLKEKKPVLFIEYDRVYLSQQQEEGIDTLKKLADIGYDSILFYDNYGRFVVSLSLSQIDEVEQLHNYINYYNAPFAFFDLCIFHKDHAALAKEFITKEAQLNKQKM